MMKLREQHLLIGSLIVVDGLALSAALAVSVEVVTAFGAWRDPLTQSWLRDRPWALLLAVPIWLLVFALSHVYRRRYLLLGPQEYAKVFSACSTGVMTLAVASVLLPGRGTVSALWLILAWIFAVVFVGAARFCFRRVINRLQRHGRFISRALIVGTNEQSKMVARLFHAPHTGIRIIGFLDDDLPPGATFLDGVPVLGSPVDVSRIVAQQRIDQLIVVREAIAWESFQEILEQTSFNNGDLDIKILPGHEEILTTGVEVQHTGFVPLLVLDRVSITGFDALMKNLLDYGLALVTAILLAPVMLFVAITLPLLGPGPIIRRERVVGRKGKTFVRYSFNMRRRSGEHRGLRALIFQMIRRFHLDLLPRLLNVLCGQMSFVGPRPIKQGREERLRQWLPNLITAKPGLTGPWAIAAGARGSLASEMRGTMYYLRNYSIWLDVEIVFHSLRKLLRFRVVRPAVAPLRQARTAGNQRWSDLARRLVFDLPIRFCAVFSVDEHRDMMVLAAVQNVATPPVDQDPEQPIELVLSESPVARVVVDEGQTLCFESPDGGGGARWMDVPIPGLGELTSGALLPIALGNRRIGVVLIGTNQFNDSAVLNPATLQRCRALIAATVATAREDAFDHSVSTVVASSARLQAQ